MTFTPIPRGTQNWDVPLNNALAELDASITTASGDALQAANNLSDLTNVPQARSNLGISNSSVTDSVYINVKDHGAIGDNSADDTAAIQSAINVCPVDGVVLFPPGKYRTTSPLLLPPGVTLLGQSQRRPRNSFMSNPNLTDNVYISPRSTFTGAAVIWVKDTQSGGWSTMAQGSAIYNIKLNCTALPNGGGIDGVQVYGQVQGLVMENVSVMGPSRYCFNFAQNPSVSSGPVNPFSMRLRGCFATGGGTATTTGGYFIYNTTDSTFIDCEAIAAGTTGWTIQGGGNTHFVNCRGENHTGNGFNLLATSGGTNCTANLVGCSTNGNAGHGFNVTAAQTVSFTACVASGEGATSAGFNIASSVGITSLSECVSPLGSTSQYGIAVSSNRTALITGGLLYGTTAGFHDGGGNTTVYKGPNVVELAGSVTTPTVSVNGVNTGEGGLGIGVTAGGGNTLKITGGTSPTMTITGTANGQQLAQIVGNDNTTTGYQSEVTGDTVNRYRVLVDGTTTWGTGAAARDTTLGRSGVGILYTDKNMLIGSATSLGDNGVGEIQLANAATAPTTNPTGGTLIYSQAGVGKTRNPQGLVNTLSGSVQATTATTTIANTTALSTLETFTVPANDPVTGAIYEMTGYGVYSVTGTPTLTFALYWGGTAGTLIAAIPAITATSGITNSPFFYRALVNFRSTTSCTAVINLSIDTSAVTDLASSYIGTPTAPTTVTTTANSALAMGFTWSAASASNTISLLGGDVRRIA
jgi:hypothetical protein